ncbi:universal stress protein [Cellulomonas sp. APG4]|uniref:universal stress protein n=1 Tax=Cellulomonas sp. APG4 TaxID=1538656 RepID=UPI00137AD179|nr:universal stress protein [Cellulomonas sp. APG4]NCT89373.1 universal stress protein [Cellulomonas sp. APG4]
MTTSLPRAWHGTHLPGTPVVVLGVTPGLPASVVRAAADLSVRMGADLVCVWADPSRVAVGQDDDGTLRSVPLDPDAVDEDAVVPEEERTIDELEHALAGRSLAWRFVYAVGDPARALDEVAHRTDALLIAVGPRRPGLAGWMDRLVGGTVAGHLVHTQHRPVLVVPPARPDA